ncbi:MAG TPA: pirin family protein [Polyangiaceae bacterium]|jgi:redox-sensitive bicupin YhaK (pirin superfamily)|nr:pirin family protein [Polyangiaceae bacterium]
MSSEVLLAARPLGFQWQTDDPFLFCVHHDDRYPAGNAQLGPSVSLAGRNLGQDFEVKDGFRMYHGRVVPGFPQHPHRGFETVTIVRRGFIDHSDSLGATARFGQGDVQWLTAGGGIVHSEMFPLLQANQENPLELFQIWLNLPSVDKLVAPYFSMFWHEAIPRHTERDAQGLVSEVTVIAGRFSALDALPPPPNSWASRADASVAIWTLKLAAGARFTLPAGPAKVNRTLYFFRGGSLKLAGRSLESHAAVKVKSDAEILIENGPLESELLLLQGRPIAETVAQYGPFVMNSRAEIEQAIRDYQRTEFGGWPWPDDGPVHERGAGRFARHADGRVERVGEGGTIDTAAGS